MTSVTLDMEKFSGKNDFRLWKVKMKALVVHHGLAGALKPNEDEESSITRERKIEIMEKAHSVIILCLGDKPLGEVSKEKTTIDVWNKFESLYQTKSVSNKLYVKQKLLNFRMSEDRNLSEQLDTFNRYVDNLKDLGVKLEDDDKALMILNALPKSLENFEDAVLFGRQDQVSYNGVLVAVKTKILRVQGRDSKADKKTKDPAKSLNVKFKKGKKSFKGKGGQFDKGKGKSKEDGFVEKRKCYACNNVGHLKKNCSEKKGNKDTADAAVAEQGYDSAEVLTISEDRMSDEWVLDSGCSFHMFPKECWFKDLEKMNEGSVLQWNDQSCKVQGILSIKIKMFDGVERVLSKVITLPDLKRNMRSLSFFTTTGCVFEANGDSISIMKKGKTLMKGEKRNNMHILAGKTVSGSADPAMSSADTLLWYKRLGHVSERGLWLI
ncbi:hypothetical protein ACS0TY_029850 [Phlomoides rotata]